MRVRDVCSYIVNKSIEYRNVYNDDSFYTTFYSVNKLIYFSHCEYLKKMNSTLIRAEDPIIADITGPFFEDTLFLFKKYNFDPIKNKIEQDFQLTISQKEVVDEVIKKYGRLTKQEIGILVKQDKAYLDAINSSSKIITNEMIINKIKEEKNNQEDAEIRKGYIHGECTKKRHITEAERLILFRASMNADSSFANKDAIVPLSLKNLYQPEGEVYRDDNGPILNKKLGKK